ncbi:Uncharacterized protein Adt_10910 [Abeliophyllum distichum]|uniref:Uncharacterized protein n=1 Tax=Abeliophyllum distichum TaxID=126358 RepID=A0ABD1ULD1_9LAMI
MLVDNGRYVNVIFLSTYEQISIDTLLEPSTETLYRFTGDCITPKGIVRLVVKMEKVPLAVHTFMKFLVVDKRNALRKAEKKEINMTFLDVEMTEASEEVVRDITIEEAAYPKDIDPKVTGVDSQTSSVEELESFVVDPNDPTRRLQVENVIF